MGKSQYQLPGCHGDDGVAELGNDVGGRVSLQQGAQRGLGVSEELSYIWSRIKEKINKTKIKGNAAFAAEQSSVRFHQ